MEGGVEMSNFIDNINDYINHHGIKKTFIAKRSDIEKNKLSRLLNGKQDILQEDMVKIASVLGKSIEYFMQGELNLQMPDYKDDTSIAFYMGTPDEGKRKLANQTFDFLEHIDVILGMRKKLEKDALEVYDYGI